MASSFQFMYRVGANVSRRIITTTRRTSTAQHYVNNMQFHRLFTTKSIPTLFNSIHRNVVTNPLMSGSADREIDGNITVDPRAEGKILKLKDAKIVADEAKKVYFESKQTNLKSDNRHDIDGINSQKAYYDDWVKHETELSDAYSKAIKYTARVRSKDTALESRILLDEMISRHGISPHSLLFSIYYDEAGRSDIIILDRVISKFIETLKFDNNGNVITNSSEYSRHGDDITNSIIIPPPTKQDFHNIIHSWASSKAKRKGLHAETLLWRMLELVKQQPGRFDFPDSKTFGLVIKCYAGSTCTLVDIMIFKIFTF